MNLCRRVGLQPGCLSVKTPMIVAIMALLPALMPAAHAQHNGPGSEMSIEGTARSDVDEGAAKPPGTQPIKPHEPDPISREPDDARAVQDTRSWKDRAVEILELQFGASVHGIHSLLGPIGLVAVAAATTGCTAILLVLWWERGRRIESYRTALVEAFRFDEQVTDIRSPADVAQHMQRLRDRFDNLLGQYENKFAAMSGRIGALEAELAKAEEYGRLRVVTTTLTDMRQELLAAEFEARRVETLLPEALITWLDSAGRALASSPSSIEKPLWGLAPAGLVLLVRSASLADATARGRNPRWDRVADALQDAVAIIRFAASELNAVIDRPLLFREEGGPRLARVPREFGASAPASWRSNPIAADAVRAATARLRPELRTKIAVDIVSVGWDWCGRSIAVTRITTFNPSEWSDVDGYVTAREQ
jgi:hypothetical protein